MRKFFQIILRCVADQNVHFVMYMFRCNGHVPATDSHRRVGAALTSAKRS